MTETSQQQRNVLICLCLAATTLAVYWPVRHFEFVNFDDPLYVTENQHVQQGVTLRAVGWALTTPLDQWMPVTWLARILECHWFGLDAGAHHLVNVLFHVVNTLLLFSVLNRITGTAWRSALVAALFALHPLHVESVAWVTGLKDVLSTFFWLLALWAYARYVEQIAVHGSWFMAHGFKLSARSSQLSTSQAGNSPGSSPIAHLSADLSAVMSAKEEAMAKTDRSPVRRLVRRSVREGGSLGEGGTLHVFYALTLCFFALGLMAKPMVVTLPFVLLLLDYWPLGRTRWAKGASGKSVEAGVGHSWRGALATSQLLLEKLPFFVLAAASCAVTLWAQQSSVSTLERLSVGSRVANAVVSYVLYIGKAFWPRGLSVFYPYLGWSPQVVIGAGAVLVGITWWALRRAHHQPYFVVGWLWYLGSLLPVIGLLQVGEQSMADRYSYLPLIGLSIMVAWAVPSGAAERYARKFVTAAIAVALLGLCALLCRLQIGYWRNSETLFRHALEVTQANWVAHNNLGTVLLRAGQVPEALDHWEQVVQIKPHYAEAHYNLGLALWRLGRHKEAVEHWEQALQIKPDIAEAHTKLGLALSEAGRVQEAITHFEEAVRLNPDDAEFQYNLGNALRQTGNIQEAIVHYERALRINPNHVTAHNNLGIALAQSGRIQEAIEQFDLSLRLKPDYVDAHYNLGLALEQAGRAAEAMAHYEQAVRLKPDFAEAQNRLALLRAKRTRLRTPGVAGQR